MAVTDQILLFDATSEAGLYHDPAARFGFFSILYRDTHRTEQHSYRLPLMAEVIRQASAPALPRRA
jgi:hypothetical protein